MWSTAYLILQNNSHGSHCSLLPLLHLLLNREISPLKCCALRLSAWCSSLVWVNLMLIGSNHCSKSLTKRIQIEHSRLILILRVWTAFLYCLLYFCDWARGEAFSFFNMQLTYYTIAFIWELWVCPTKALSPWLRVNYLVLSVVYLGNAGSLIFLFLSPHTCGLYTAVFWLFDFLFLFIYIYIYLILNFLTLQWQ